MVQSMTDAFHALPSASAIYITGAGIQYPFGMAHGFADESIQKKLTVDTPFRIASNTKTFLAAAFLRLWEQDALSLDDDITKYLSANYQQTLLELGYDLKTITLRHLLSHSSGLFDHANEAYLEEVIKDPTHKWTREEQIARYAQQGFPIIPAGKRFIYSDTGYILLGDILSQFMKKNMATAVRDLLHFQNLDLPQTWWEGLEQQPKHFKARARQFTGEHEGTHIDASMDAFGGGGLVMTTLELAKFTADLFEDRVYLHPSTLKEMKWQGSHTGAENYRLGLMAEETSLGTLYYHLGYWGSVAYYLPEKQIAIAGFTTQRNHREDLIAIIKEAFKRL
ncbi:MULTISPECIES: serine hydrolase domain-containing protein [Enterobacterales]|uniref:serine hydrolase domain-containing protein n=1 Tax=Enterobacterales TaxID=91347 RepID=UPI0008481B15|nr:MULTISPECIES: serine hydrolase domain-containing protein [Enterobacterales]WOO49587.1 serine hydrolase domain-containing protein [Hafnia alvei]MCK9780422.1 beta-lactamase family protein [Proteus columbae]MCT6516360.1 beta-lactamase family protein [Proteus vulgaris]ODQ03956.1 serine hydrolase [Shigella sp. FC130]OEI91639.1 serine hydrolase [Shigella sp. FC1655]